MDSIFYRFQESSKVFEYMGYSYRSEVIAESLLIGKLNPFFAQLISEFKHTGRNTSILLKIVKLDPELFKQLIASKH